jgi:hypothetical protein
MTSITSSGLAFKLQKQAKLCSVVFKDAYLETIIKFCRLKPLDPKSHIKKTTVADIWVDEFGNSIKLTKKEKQIKLNDLSLDRSKIINTDFYCKLPIEKISKISRMLFAFVGKEEDFQSKHLILGFVGIDNVLRVFCLIYNEVFAIPPLSLGYRILRLIAKNFNCEDIKHFKNNKDVLYPCSGRLCFLAPLPAGPELKFLLEKNDIDLIV